MKDGFTPLESPVPLQSLFVTGPAIYSGDETYKSIPYRKDGVKALSFLTGFTLVELLVITLIFSFIIAGIYGVLNVGKLTFSEGMALLDLQQQARQAMAIMVKEIRQSKASEITFVDGNTKVIFKIVPPVYGDPWIGPISYYRDVNDSNNDELVNQIIREYPYPATSEDDFRILANDITSLNFSLSGNILEICLAANRTVGTRELCFPAPCQSPAKTLKETIMLRN